MKKRKRDRDGSGESGGRKDGERIENGREDELQREVEKKREKRRRERDEERGGEDTKGELGEVVQVGELRKTFRLLHRLLQYSETCFVVLRTHFMDIKTYENTLRGRKRGREQQQEKG